MRTNVKQWGNSASVRIPASIMAAASLRIDQEVDIREEGGRVIIQPVTVPAALWLAENATALTSSNAHVEAHGIPLAASRLF
jgi:antitoxin MazE